MDYDANISSESSPIATAGSRDLMMDIYSGFQSSITQIPPTTNPYSFNVRPGTPPPRPQPARLSTIGKHILTVATVSIDARCGTQTITRPLDASVLEPASKADLDRIQIRHPLPLMRGPRKLTRMRYLVATFYRRLMALVLFLNLATICSMIAYHVSSPSAFTYANAATATGVNLMTAVLMRQEHVINLLFHLACSLPRSAPLWLRRLAAKMAYNNGGVHAGAAISALGWYVLHVAFVGSQFDGEVWQKDLLLVVTAATLTLLIAIISLAHPTFRRKHHDVWELSHRFGGWTAIALVWVQIILIAVFDAQSTHQPIGTSLVHLPTFWFLIVITSCLVYPWLRLRRLPVSANRLSSHATQLHFTNRTLATCRGVRISTNPLLQNHGFATIPNPAGPLASSNDLEKGSAAPLTALPPLPARRGYTLLVSKAGDFTTSLIHDPPPRLYIRGAPTIGVMRLSSLFTPILIITTGSGIGPCLSWLTCHRHHPKRIVWSARSPAQTYGAEIVRRVKEADREAVVIDTMATGTPDLVTLGWGVFKGMGGGRGGEAVMCISNHKVTRNVVFGFEGRGVPAFGAIFDS